jgi:5,10-methylenetetrahydromethanopterin reductase
MTAITGAPVGLAIGSATAPEQVAPLARLAEDAGFGEIWIPEDYFFLGGVSSIGIALGATERIKVGTGIVSAVARHPAVLAMEIATLSRAYPGRIMPGIGLGVPLWLDQMGIKPKSGLTAVRETFENVRGLLQGEEVTRESAYYSMDKVKLVHPPTEDVPLIAGLMGPKMLRLAGQVADGVLIGASASQKYVAWARERVAEGAAEIGRDVSGFRYPTFVLFSVDRDSKKAKERCRGQVAFYLSIVGRSAYSDTQGISEEMVDMLERGGMETLEREMPQQWVDELCIAGDPDECAEQIKSWLAAGSDSVVLFPAPAELGVDMVRMAGETIMPQLEGVAG